MNAKRKYGKAQNGIKGIIHYLGKKRHRQSVNGIPRGLWGFSGEKNKCSLVTHPKR
jgi:hypothetical protein